jgi:hypothetical protein
MPTLFTPRSQTSLSLLDRILQEALAAPGQLGNATLPITRNTRWAGSGNATPDCRSAPPFIIVITAASPGKTSDYLAVVN